MFILVNRAVPIGPSVHRSIGHIGPSVHQSHRSHRSLGPSSHRSIGPRSHRSIGHNGPSVHRSHRSIGHIGHIGPSVHRSHRSIGHVNIHRSYHVCVVNVYVYVYVYDRTTLSCISNVGPSFLFGLRFRSYYHSGKNVSLRPFTSSIVRGPYAWGP